MCALEAKLQEYEARFEEMQVTIARLVEERDAKQPVKSTRRQESHEPTHLKESKEKQELKGGKQLKLEKRSVKEEVGPSKRLKRETQDSQDAPWIRTPKNPQVCSINDA